MVLIAQETTLYGIDLYGKKRLHELLQELCKINSLVWIRVLYCYPEEIYDELIDIFAAEKKICKYIDIPIQHCSNNILKKMGRRTSKEDIIAIVKKLRKKVPDITIRTTLITGFPGETNEDHEEVLEFVDRMEFDRLGVFTYSAEEDTPAATMDEQIDEEIKKERLNEIMSLQQEISYDKNQRLIGKEMMVIIEGYMPDDVVYVGRTYRDTAGIDGNVFIKSDSTLMSGDIITVKIISANEYDLIGEML